MTDRTCETHFRSTPAAIFTSGANWLLRSPATSWAPCASSAATFCGSRFRFAWIARMSREVSPVATFRTWLTTTEGLRTERTPEADSRTSRGVVASGVIWLSTVSAAADSEVRSEDVAGSVVGPLLASLLAVSAITSKFESARLRSDCAALSSTWPALFSAVPTGVAASCPFATGLTAPDSSSFNERADGVRQSCCAGDDLLEIDRAVGLRQFAGQVVGCGGEAGKVGMREIRCQSSGQAQIAVTSSARGLGEQ